MSDAEDIGAWQAAWNTPREVVDAVVRRAAGSGVVVDERILEGHGNEVHGVRTADGQDLVVRICRRQGAGLDCERWPISAALAAGVPAPPILLVERLDLNGEELSIQVQQRLPGRTVHRLFGELSDAQLERLTTEAGEILAMIHAIQPSGPGPIDPAGSCGALPSTAGDAVVAAMIRRNGELTTSGIDTQLLQTAVEAVETGAALLDAAPICLIHGDWRTTNVLSDGDSITGVVDWEGARGGDAAFDFAGVWTVASRREATSTELLLDAYRAAGARLDDSFHTRRLLYSVADLHSALGHFVSTDRPDLLERAVDDLHATLRRLHDLT